VTELTSNTVREKGLSTFSGEALRAQCLGLPNAVEEFPFRDPEVSAFKVAGKIFAISKLTASRLSVSVKCDPDLALALRSQYAAIEPGYHLNKRHWITVDVQGDVDGDLVRQLVEDSYDAVRPRSGPRDPASRRDQGATP
jgi:predicted DNA-binding protein (MmcQ/YjbR family)